MRRAQNSVIGAGNNGAVVQGPEGVVYKYTRDPVEVQSWLAAASLARRNRYPKGLPALYDIHLGDRAAVITREDIQPLGTRHGIDPYSVAVLQASARLNTKGNLFSDRRARLRSNQLRSRGLYGQLRQIGHAVKALERLGASPGDLRPDNIGRSEHGLVLHDPGRSPVSTTLARSKGEYDKCPDTKKLSSAIKTLIGRSPSYKACKIVNPAGMRRVMKSHGWRDKEIGQTAGFHSQDSVIYLLSGNEWSLLHELIHAAGVVDSDMAPWLTEGITEAVAQDIAAQKKWKHRTTYPQWVAVVRDQVAAPKGVSDLDVLQLGKMVAARPNRAGGNLAQRLETQTGIPAKKWYKTIGPGGLSPQPFLALAKKARRSA